MPPQSHTVQVTILGMNGIVAQGNNAEESASRVSTIISFARKKSIHTSAPSCPLVKTRQDYDERSDRSSKMLKSTFMSTWGYDDDAMSEGCILTYQTKLHPKKDGYETKSYDVNVGLIRGNRTILLGSSTLNVTGPIPGMQFDLPIRLMNSVSNTKMKKKVGMRRSNSFSGNLPLEPVDCVSGELTTVQFIGDSETKFSLEEDASLRIYVSIMSTKLFDAQSKLKAMQRSVVLNQLQMVAANSHSQPIIVNALSTDSPMSSISHTIYTNEGQSLIKESFHEERSHRTSNSGNSRSFKSLTGMNGIQPTKDSSIAGDNKTSPYGSPCINKNIRRKSNLSPTSRPPLPLSSLPRRTPLSEEKSSVQQTVTTGASSTNLDPTGKEVSPNTNLSKGFSLKKAISKMSPKRANCTAPPQVLGSSDKREEIKGFYLRPQSPSPIVRNNSKKISMNVFRSTSPLRKLQSQLQISASGGTGQTSRSGSPMITRREEDKSTSDSIGKLNNRHQHNNLDLGQGMRGNSSIGSRRGSTDRTSSSPMKTSRDGGSQNSKSIKSSSEKYSRHRHAHEGDIQNSYRRNSKERRGKNLISKYELVPKYYQEPEVNNRVKEMNNSGIVMQEREILVRSPTQDGCTSVLSGPTMSYRFEEGIHPYEGRALDQMHMEPARHSTAVSKQDDGLYGIIQSGLMCNPQQQAPCSGNAYETTSVINETPLAPKGPPMIVRVQPDAPSVGELTFTTYEREHTKSIPRSMIPAAFGGEGMCHHNSTRKAMNDRSWIVDEEYRHVGDGGIVKTPAVQKRGIGNPPKTLKKIREVIDDRDDRPIRHSASSKSSSGTSDGRSSAYTKSSESYRNKSRRHRTKNDKGRYSVSRNHRNESRRYSYESDDYESNEDDCDSSITDGSYSDPEETRRRDKRYDYDHEDDYRSTSRYRKASQPMNSRKRDVTPNHHYRGIQ